MSPFTVPLHTEGVRRLLVAAVALGTILLLSGSSWADSCSSMISLTNSNPQVTCVMPQMNSQQTMNVGMQYLSFAPQSQGMVLIYDNSLHTQLADVVTFTNVNGVATISFTADVGSSFTVPNLPVLGSYTEGPNQGYFFLTLALSNGKDMHVGICTSEQSTCNGGGDSLKVSVGNVPEPGTFFLMGTGVLGSGAWSLVRGAWAKRFLRQIRS